MCSYVRLHPAAPFVVGAVLAVLLAPQARGADEEGDEVVLERAKLSSDGGALVAYLRAASGQPRGDKDPGAWIEQLGDSDFEKREEASRALIASGVPALPLLRKAARHTDAEIARRAADCVAAIERTRDPVVIAAVVHTLGREAAAGTVDALFGFLPSADTEDLQEEVWLALDAAAAREKKLPPVLARVTGESHRSQRAAAGYLLARRGDASQRAAAKRFLSDPDTLVRLRTAQGFLGAEDKAGIPTLIGLLADAPLVLAWQAEELLHYAAEEKDAPEAVIGTGTAAERKRCRETWETWWRKAEPTLELSSRRRQARRPILYLTHTYWLDPDLIQLWGCDGAVRWTLKTTGRLSDAHLLPGGTLLVVVYASGPRVKPTEHYGLSERDVTGRVLWEYKVMDAIWCQPLRGRPEVNLRITGHFVPDEPLPPRAPPPHEGEVRRGGKLIRCFHPRNKAESERQQTWSGLPGAGTISLDEAYNKAALGLQRVIEKTAEGKVVWESAAFAASLRVCLPLVRLGFDAARPKDLDVESIPSRIAELASRNRAMRELCADALERKGPKAAEAIPALMDMFASAEDYQERYRAHDALAQILRPGDYPAVRKATGDKRAGVREAAVGLLGQFPEHREEALAIVFERLHDKDPTVRWAAVQALTNSSLKSDPKQVIPAMIAALKDDGCPHGDKRDSVGATAAFALVRYQPDPRVAVPALQDALAKGRIPLRRAALGGLATLALRETSFVPTVLDTVLAVLRHDDSSEIRRAAAGALGMLGKYAESAVPDLIKLVEAKRQQPLEGQALIQLQFEQEAAIEALGRIGPGASKAIPVLQKALGEDNPLRHTAAEALRRIREGKGNSTK